MLKHWLFKTINPKAARDLSFLYVQNPYQGRRIEARDMERCFTRLFASEDGQKVLSHLQIVTFHRALGAEVDDKQLRYIEGQRSLVSLILKMVERGRVF